MSTKPSHFTMPDVICYQLSNVGYCAVPLPSAGARYRTACIGREESSLQQIIQLQLLLFSEINRNNHVSDGAT
jgi:hypothetical protein